MKEKTGGTHTEVENEREDRGTEIENEREDMDTQR
jgi:hypothetical protein